MPWVTCDHCKGKGKVPLWIEKDRSWGWEKCYACKGRGRTKKLV